MKMRVFLTLAMAVSSCLVGCNSVRHNLPPAQRLMEPGPGVGGPGPGVMAPDMGPAGGMAGMGMGGDVVAASYCGPEGDLGMMMPGGGTSVQMLFNRPEGMEVHYDIVGDGTFGSEPLYVPGRLEFPAGAIYRLKLTNIQGREGVELYPTVEVAGSSPRTAAYLAHNAIPIQFTPDDFEQVLSGNFVTKVIYLPDPEFQGDALVGVDVLVSNRLDPGLDPIVEADRRGSILAIIRLGNKDIELSGVNAAGGMAGAGMMMGGGMMGGGLPPGVAGATGPQYGMTYTGTPIGLPGPPHIPLGTPAGLKSHTIRNTTHRQIPDPVEHMRINVRQTPGQSYPTSPDRVRIRESNIHPGARTGMPLNMRGSQSVTGAGGEISDGAYCPPE